MKTRKEIPLDMERKILVLGDSISAGYYDLERGGWASRLKTFMLSKNENFRVYNWSISGANTADILKLLEVSCKAINPHRIIFAIGANDATYLSTKKDYTVPHKQFKKNLIKLIKLARRYTSEIYFLGLTPVDEPLVTPMPWYKIGSIYNKYLKEYTSILRDVCKQNKLTFISTFDKVPLKELYDGVHPNAVGHKRIFEIVKRQLLKDIK